VQCREAFKPGFLHLAPIEAAKAYDRKARELFGPFARLNFPSGTGE
jgi:hypothetical protein